MVRASWIVAVMAGSRIAAGDPPTSRAYAIALDDGVAFGNSATVAMGGAAVGNAIGSSGTLFNPSAPAVRSTTDTDVWSWDYHLDALSSSLSRDVDNNGRATATGGSSSLTLGLAGRYHDWAAAFTATYQQAPLVGATAPIDGRDVTLHATTTRSRIAIAKYIPRIDVAVGVAVDVAQFSLVPECATAGCGDLFAITGAGVAAGATWLPSLESFRVGVAASSSLQGGRVQASTCDPMDCAGYLLPDSIVAPWRIAAGFAYRRADTAWNQLFGGLWRDEPALTFAGDLVVTGASPNAYGLEAFGMHDLQRDGRHVSVSPRAGVEYEWLPGRLRLRFGSYYEPSRFDDVGGRLHATFGTELRVLQIHLFGLRRGRITLTGDVAPRYNNVGVSIGFWH